MARLYENESDATRYGIACGEIGEIYVYTH